jgi:UDP-2,3-diacylglucosamine pyrophosphatase LpxH
MGFVAKTSAEKPSVASNYAQVLQQASHEPPEEAHEEEGEKHFRAIFISDIHLGTPGCQAEALLEFLRTHSSDTLYLVGDIIDGWQLRRRWYWPQAHNDVIQKLLRRARKGCRVVFVPGNHDEFARRYVAHNFGGVDIVEDCVHTLADGRRLWITHGDLFDGVIQCA